tara:strand:+ start:599 stop:865 length:267 start_codon:yes stop_codon:yes gene_type:complete
MSYLDTIKEEVEEAKEAEIGLFKQFMEDYCISQFKDSLSNPSAMVHPESLLEEGISVEGFISWLEGEGFSVQATNNSGVIIISYLGKE